MIRKLICFFRGHDYVVVIRARKILDHKTRQSLGLASLLKCTDCGDEKTVVTWNEGVTKNGT